MIIRSPIPRPPGAGTIVGGEPIDFEIGPDGLMEAQLPHLVLFDSLTAEYR